MKTLDAAPPRPRLSAAMTLNLLLVEDDTLYAQALANELRTIGHAIAIASDGRQALTVMNEAAFDAVILDRMMPRLDGMSVLQTLRAGGMTLPV
ncbi:MAG: response regulator, partial [Sphingomonas sp.]